MTHELAGALQQASSLRSQLDAARCVMDLSPQGFLQIDATGAVLYANKIARNDEIFSLQSGRLRLQTRKGDSAFREAIRSALSDRPRLRRLNVECSIDGKSRRLLLIPPRPMTAAFRADSPTVPILVAGDSTASKPAPTLLSEIFSLTPAEARVTAYLVAGYSVQEIADELDITCETAARTCAAFSSRQTPGAKVN